MQHSYAKVFKQNGVAFKSNDLPLHDPSRTADGLMISSLSSRVKAMSGCQLFGAGHLTAEEQATANAQSSISTGVGISAVAVKKVRLVEANTESNEVKSR